jgi:hypothetical protein
MPGQSSDTKTKMLATGAALDVSVREFYPDKKREWLLDGTMWFLRSVQRDGIKSVCTLVEHETLPVAREAMERETAAAKRLQNGGAQ